MPRGHLRGISAALAALLSIGVGLEALGSQRPVERPPNIVLIIGDDHGWPYAGFMGNPVVATPNLDALAAGGTVFTHVFASGNVCQPSLRTLLSGLESESWEAQRDRLEETFGSALPRAEEVQRFTTLPRLLARSGYRSFEAGKHWEGTWWNAGFSAGTANATPLPLQLPRDGFGRPSVSHMEGFLDSVGDEPFFLWLAPSVPHVPLDPPAALQMPYRAMGLVEPAVLYYANVTRLDTLVGEMLASLRARGLERDTLIVYLSDNGWQQDPDEAHAFGTLFGGPRGKATIYELGLRAPTILYAPGRVLGGRRDDGLATFADVNATLLDYAGVALPPDHEGVSLRSRALGYAGRRRRAVFGVANLLRVPETEQVEGAPVVRAEQAAYMRTRRWRYVAYLAREGEELYRIDEDPLEEVDVLDEYPWVADALRARLFEELERRSAPAQLVDLNGRLRKLSGDPVVGLPLTLHAPSHTFEGVTDASGRFQFRNVPAMRHWLRMPVALLFLEGEVIQNYQVELSGLESGPFLELLAVGADNAASPARVGSSVVRVEYRDLYGRRVADLPVLLEAFDESGEALLRVRGRTGADGLFLADHLPAARYRLAALRPGCDSSRSFDLGEASQERARERLACGDERSSSAVAR